MVERLTADVLRAVGVRHGFFGRRGGVSTGPFASLNVGPRSGDDPARVRENRARVARVLGVAPERLLTARQVHGRTVAVVDRPFPPDRAPEADALVVERPDLAIGVTTADCAPLLIVDPFGPRAAAVHAGWRGLAAGVIEAAVEALVRRRSRVRELRAAVGPCIGVASYEVGPDVHAAVCGHDPALAAHFRPGQMSGRWWFDLAGAAAAVLRACGLEAGRVEVLGRDTCAEAERFFSHRRSRLRGERRFGLQLSALVLSLPDLEEETAAAGALHQPGEDETGDGEP